MYIGPIHFYFSTFCKWKCPYHLSFCVFFCVVFFFKKNIFLFIFLATSWHVGSYFPNQGLNPCPLLQKCGILTTWLPGNSLHCFLAESILSNSLNIVEYKYKVAFIFFQSLTPIMLCPCKLYCQGLSKTFLLRGSFGFTLTSLTSPSGYQVNYRMLNIFSC